MTAAPRPPQLVVIRGNSASGKTTVSRMLIHAATQPAAYVSQDVLRRDILREGGERAGDSVGLIDVVTRWLLASGYNVVLDGILSRKSHGYLLHALARDWPTHFVYFDLPIEETIRRHGTKSLAEVDEAQLHKWFRSHDALGVEGEWIFGEQRSAEQIVASVIARGWWPG